MSNDSNIATPSTSIKHLMAVAQAKREQPHSATLPHFISIEETDNSILFISNPSPIWGSSSDHSSPVQIHLDGEAIEDIKDGISHIESRSPITFIAHTESRIPKTFVRPLSGCKASAQGH